MLAYVLLIQVEPDCTVAVEDLTAVLEKVGFKSKCVATSTTEEPMEDPGVTAVWAIASALGEAASTAFVLSEDHCPFSFPFGIRTVIVPPVRSGTRPSGSVLASYSSIAL